MKIGHTTNSIRSRLSALQTGAPFDLTCHNYIETSGGLALQIEGAIHRLLYKRRIRGEWFNMSVDEIIPVAKEAIFIIGGTEDQIIVDDHGDSIP